MLINKDAPATPAFPGTPPGIILVSQGGSMTKKRVVVHAECPACACGDISFIPPEKMKDKFIGNPKEVDILCPTCGTKTTGKVSEEKK
jgi:hypothetical protein